MEGRRVKVFSLPMDIKGLNSFYRDPGVSVEREIDTPVPKQRSIVRTIYFYDKSEDRDLYAGLSSDRAEEEIMIMGCSGKPIKRVSCLDLPMEEHLWQALANSDSVEIINETSLVSAPMEEGLDTQIVLMLVDYYDHEADRQWYLENKVSLKEKELSMDDILENYRKG